MTLTTGDLRGIPLLESLNDAATAALLQAAQVHAFAPDEVLWSAGDQPRGLHIVLEGTVRVVTSGARRQVIHIEQRGGTLGDVALFAGQRFPATAIAASRVRCLVLDEHALYAVIAGDPRFAHRLLTRLAVRVRELIARLERVTTHSVTTRLAAYLIDRAADSNRSFTLGATQSEVAEELGTVREVIVRTLAAFREAGVIDDAGRGRYQVLDKARLQQLAGG